MTAEEFLIKRSKQSNRGILLVTRVEVISALNDYAKQKDERIKELEARLEKYEPQLTDVYQNNITRQFGAK